MVLAIVFFVKKAVIKILKFIPYLLKKQLKNKCNFYKNYHAIIHEEDE